MKRLIAWSLAAAVLVACAPTRPSTPTDGSAPAASAAPKRISAAIMADPPAVFQELTGFGQRGTDALQELVVSGLSSQDNFGVLRPQLAEAVPSVDNGLWRVLPDGRMEMTWRIRDGARWHDGMPFTSQDLLFATQVGQDRELPEFGNAAYALVDSIEAPDPRTISVSWKSPYIEADLMFGTRQYATPLPRHLLEKPFIENKVGFTQLPYWNEAFVGTGPYRVREFVRGSHLLLDANDDFALGRPKIDTIELKFIPDPTTVAANILAGTVELTLGKTLSVEQAVEVGAQWRDGKLDFTPSNAISIYSQFMDANPPIVTNLQFRRALLHAIDRQELADTLLAGYSSVAHSSLFPNQPLYQEIEARLPRYEHDPRRAMQLIEGLGYVRRTDGFFAREAGGELLSVELRTYTVDINQKATLSVADAWQRTGVKVDTLVMSPQAAQNNEYVFTYPAFLLQRYTSDLSGLRNLYGSRAPRPENNFRSGNVSRYMNPAFDALLDRYFGTIPMGERTQILGEIILHVADQLTQMGLVYDAEPTMIGNRIANVGARWPSSTQAWNAHLWDAR
jgi:peptide/nickel transport system substrate-binding protein